MLNEQEIINSLFEAGMEVFQVHKPLFSEKEIQNYIQKIPAKYHNKITLHSQYLKFHSLKELEVCKEKYEYVFLSPIFDSISKSGYKSAFDLDELKNSPLIFSRRGAGGEVFALGGIDEDKIELVSELGFDGVGVLGALWSNKNPIEKFKQLFSLCNSIEAPDRVSNPVRVNTLNQ